MNFVNHAVRKEEFEKLVLKGKIKERRGLRNCC